MKDPLFIHQNIKFLRNRKGRTQAEAADAMKFSRSQLAGYELTIRPTLEALLLLSDYYGFTTDALLRLNLTKLTEFKLREIETGAESFISGNKLRVLPIMVDKGGRELTEVVPYKARAGYLNGYSDPGYIGELPRMNFPFLPQNRKHRIFQLDGDSMLPMQNASHVVCSYVDDWNNLEEGAKYILLTKNEGIVFKLVYPQPAKENTLLLCSTNPLYKPYKVLFEEILEIWKYELHLTV